MILPPKFDRQLNAMLERRKTFESLEDLILALDGTTAEVPFAETAIVFDSSAVLRLPSLRASEDIVDYLRTKHRPPVVLPGQAIQEFWNNHGDFIRTAAGKLRQRVNELRLEIAGLGTDLSEFVDRLDQMVDEFELSHGNLYDEGVARKTRSLLTALKEKAIVAYANRSSFQHFADQRQKTKTPPGFKDTGDGDFYVWLDAMAGLYLAHSRQQKFTCVALVTMDKKKDWTSNNLAHPILCAEVRSMFNAKFAVWDLNRLEREVTAAL